MTLSLWRSSHLILALSSALFLVMASVTGIILAFEPIATSVRNYSVVPLQDVTVGEGIHTLLRKQKNPITITVTPDHFVTASFITEEGVTEHKYIDPRTGEPLGDVIEKSTFYNWVTTFHRSLFLKGIGRFFVGFVSLLLCFIAVTGILLLAQRQGGFLKLYARVHEKNSNQRYHVILGRWFLVPITIIAATGVFLSAEKFELLPETTKALDWNAPVNEDLPSLSTKELPFFKNTTLASIRQITFPFSEFPEDYYEIALRDREVLVHQYTGEVVSEVRYPFVQLASYWSVQIHTGQGIILWSMVLIIASASILFFIFSGFAMYLKRRKKTEEKLIMPDRDVCEFIILVGSESGDTHRAATRLFKSLRQAGKSVFICSLNEYCSYKKAQHLIIFTSTYGDGDAPTNARHFERIFSNIEQPNAMQYSVVGFGSADYDDFCGYATRIDMMLQGHPKFIPTISLHKINDQSPAAINMWYTEWSNEAKVPLDLLPSTAVIEPPEKQLFTVVMRTPINQDNTFVLQLKSQNELQFQSGDILEIIPAGETQVRKYSIGRVGDNMLLAIKKHDFGVCSSYLYTLKEGETIEASIRVNSKFHFPRKVSSVVLIANGTGIGPFLGMIDEAPKDVPVYIFWGGRSSMSWELYETFVSSVLSRKQNIKCYAAFSRMEKRQYVQDVLAENKSLIATVLKADGKLLICGSLAMQRDVLKTLEYSAQQKLKLPLSTFENKGQVITDCY